MRGWMGTGTILKLVAGIGMGMGFRVPGTVRMVYNIIFKMFELFSFTI